MADRLFIFTSKIQGLFRQPIRRVYGRIISNCHYKTNNVGVKNETNTAPTMGNLLSTGEIFERTFYNSFYGERSE